MRSNGEIRMFKLGVEADEFCVVFTSDYCDHVRKANTVTSVNKLVIGKGILFQYRSVMYSTTLWGQKGFDA